MRNMVDTNEDQPFSETNIASDRENVTNYYFNNGFPDVQFEAAYRQVSSDPPRGALTYKITQGRQIFVENAFLSRLHFTRPYVANREDQQHKGDPPSQAGRLNTQPQLHN